MGRRDHARSRQDHPRARPQAARGQQRLRRAGLGIATPQQRRVGNARGVHARAPDGQPRSRGHELRHARGRTAGSARRVHPVFRRRPQRRAHEHGQRQDIVLFVAQVHRRGFGFPEGARRGRRARALHGRAGSRGSRRCRQDRGAEKRHQVPLELRRQLHHQPAR